MELYGFSPEKHDSFFLRHRICLAIVREAVLSNDFAGSLAWFWWVNDVILCYIIALFVLFVFGGLFIFKGYLRIF